MRSYEGINIRRPSWTPSWTGPLKIFRKKWHHIVLKSTHYKLQSGIWCQKINTKFPRNYNWPSTSSQGIGCLGLPNHLCLHAIALKTEVTRSRLGATIIKQENESQFDPDFLKKKVSQSMPNQHYWETKIWTKYLCKNSILPSIYKTIS